MALKNKERALLVKLFRMVALFSYSERIPAYKVIKKKCNECEWTQKYDFYI